MFIVDRSLPIVPLALSHDSVQTKVAPKIFAWDDPLQWKHSLSYLLPQFLCIPDWSNAFHTGGGKIPSHGCPRHKSTQIISHCDQRKEDKEQSFLLPVALQMNFRWLTIDCLNFQEFLLFICNPTELLQDLRGLLQSWIYAPCLHSVPKPSNHPSPPPFP